MQKDGSCGLIFQSRSTTSGGAPYHRSFLCRLVYLACGLHKNIRTRTQRAFEEHISLGSKPVHASIRKIARMTDDSEALSLWLLLPVDVRKPPSVLIRRAKKILVSSANFFRCLGSQLFFLSPAGIFERPGRACRSRRSLFGIRGV